MYIVYLYFWQQLFILSTCHISSTTCKKFFAKSKHNQSTESIEICFGLFDTSSLECVKAKLRTITTTTMGANTKSESTEHGYSQRWIYIERLAGLSASQKLFICVDFITLLSKGTTFASTQPHTGTVLQKYMYMYVCLLCLAGY